MQKLVIKMTDSKYEKEITFKDSMHITTDLITDSINVRDTNGQSLFYSRKSLTEYAFIVDKK